MRLLQILYLLPLLLPGQLNALAHSTDVLIVELQVRSTTSADHEFVEIYNTTDSTIDISGWELQYQSSSGTSWSQKAQLSGKLFPHGRMLLASENYLTDIVDSTFKSGLSDSGGHVRLASPDSLNVGQFTVHDLIGWGTASKPEGTKAPAPKGGESLERKVNDQGMYVDTDDNSLDFRVNTIPTPESLNDNPDPEPSLIPPEEPEPLPEPQPTDGESKPDDTGTQPPSTPSGGGDKEIPSQLLSLQITEMLPNPAPPQSDGADEFIELYNPNDEPVDLGGYKLQSGNSFSYSYVFTDETIGAKSYATFYVGDTGLLLSNSSGKARLFTPDGQVIAEVMPYIDAKEGFAWAWSGGIWQWSTFITPNQPNIITMPVAAVKAAKTTTTKTAAAKKAAASKTATTAKKASTTKAKTTKVDDNQPAKGTIVTTTIAPLHPGVIAVVSAIAVGYAAYEYRYDMSNRLYQLRRYREARRIAREAASGR
ncbi:MAG: Non specific extracellular endonuclease cleaving [Candidatus Saccharibacteria bacterium]|nr:Non specific extracellular endonuclease cleaving [Candidatus Saccharibacteria bacterium]